MALKRLDEEFELKPGTQLLPYMQRLLPSLEGRFQSLEATAGAATKVMDEIKAAALLRMNEILIPATEDIIAVTKLGFMLGPCSNMLTLQLGYFTMVIDEGVQRQSFTPSPYVLVENGKDPENYAIARVIGYYQSDGLLELNITAIHGSPGPNDDWMVSSTPGMADSTKEYHDAIAPMHTEIVADYADINIKHQEILDAAQALAESGLDAYAFIRKDGTVPFEAVMTGFAPPASSNNRDVPTTAWSRARMQEYSNVNVSRAGDAMTGPLSLYGPPSQALHATTKAYVDSAIGAGGTIYGNITIQTTNPQLVLRATSTGQYRNVAGVNPVGAARWNLFVGDNSVESGGNAGSDFVLHRYADSGAYLGQGFSVNRNSGTMAVNSLTYNGSISGTGGNADFRNADLGTYRAPGNGGTNTGVLFMNAARNAYHHYDGATHNFVGGGIACGGSAINGGHVTCYSIYTQGYGVTCWGITSHGTSNLNGQVYINNGGLRLYGGGSNLIELYDSDWGPMYIHHNQDLVGFLNNGGGWCMWVTNAGHIWAGQYGWIHDYVNNTASNHAWSAANYRYSQLVSETRMPYYGDPHWQQGLNQVWEPYWGGFVTGFYRDWNGFIHHTRFRCLQVCINGGWYTTRYD